MAFIYLAPGDMIGLQGTGLGASAPTYNINWICDGLPGRPVRAPGYNVTWSATGPAAKPLKLITLVNTNLDVGLSVAAPPMGTMPPVLGAGRVPLNPFLYNATFSGTYTIFSVIVPTNSQHVIAGQLMGGNAKTLERPLQPGATRTWQTFNRQPDPQMGNVAIYRVDKYARVLTGSTTMTQAGLDALQAWYDSTNDNELPSIIVPDPSINDAWCVKFGPFAWRKQSPSLYTVDLTFVEIPRARW